MAWTYSAAPGTSTSAARRDAVRLLVGDTQTADQQLTDDEIQWFLTLAGSPSSATSGTEGQLRIAAIKACRALVAKYARQADTTHGKLSVKASQRSTHYAELADSIAAEHGAIAEAFAGGLTISGNEALDEDSDAVQPTFGVGMDDHDGTAPTADWESS